MCRCKVGRIFSGNEIEIRKVLLYLHNESGMHVMMLNIKHLIGFLNFSNRLSSTGLLTN